MKTKLYDALSILAHFIKDKLNIPDAMESSIPNVVASMQVALAGHIAKAKHQGYITEDNFLLLDKFEPVVRKQFEVFPAMKLPMGNMSFVITEADINKLLKALKDKAVAEEVICLPLQK